MAVLSGYCLFLFFFAGSRALLVNIGGSWLFLVVHNDILVVPDGSCFFLFLIVLGCFWWFLAVLSVSWW